MCLIEGHGTLTLLSGPGGHTKVLLLGPLGRSLTPKTEGGSEFSQCETICWLGGPVASSCLPPPGLQPPSPSPCSPHGPSCRTGPPLWGRLYAPLMDTSHHGMKWDFRAGVTEKMNPVSGGLPCSGEPGGPAATLPVVYKRLPSALHRASRLAVTENPFLALLLGEGVSSLAHN